MTSKTMQSMHTALVQCYSRQVMKHSKLTGTLIPHIGMIQFKWDA